MPEVMRKIKSGNERHVTAATAKVRWMHKWDETRKYEQEEFTFDDDATE
jgi:hypothetical protein